MGWRICMLLWRALCGGLRRDQGSALVAACLDPWLLESMGSSRGGMGLLMLFWRARLRYIGFFCCIPMPARPEWAGKAMPTMF